MENGQLVSRLDNNMKLGASLILYSNPVIPEQKLDFTKGPPSCGTLARDIHFTEVYAQLSIKLKLNSNPPQRCCELMLPAYVPFQRLSPNLLSLLTCAKAHFTDTPSKSGFDGAWQPVVLQMLCIARKHVRKI